MDVSAFVSGCSGKALTADERAFFAAEQPWGLILFLKSWLNFNPLLGANVVNNVSNKLVFTQI